jgi:hypothetical protein
MVIGTYLTIPNKEFFYKGTAPDKFVPSNELVLPTGEKMQFSCIFKPELLPGGTT